MNIKTILTTYLTKKGDPQRAAADRAKPNDPTKMGMWYPPPEGCKGIVIHDELSKEFMDQYPEVMFLPAGNYPYSCNDGRFWLFADFLRLNADDQVWVSDLFDVKVNYLPDMEENTLYVSNEGQNWHLRTGWMREKHRLFNTSDLQGKMVYNPGVFGGCHDVMVPFIEDVKKELLRMNVGMKNGNMVAFNRVVHRFKGTIVTGYPLHTRFKAYENDSKAAFQHK